MVCSSLTVLAGPLLDVATKPTLSIVSLGWKVCVGSGVVLEIASLARSASGQTVCVFGLGGVFSFLTALDAPLFDVVTKRPL
jgi:hypothetical protein